MPRPFSGAALVKALDDLRARCGGRGRPAHAGEVFGGLFVHDVDTPLDISGIEGGEDVQLVSAVGG